jgi:hypothetical protein
MTDAFAVGGHDHPVAVATGRETGGRNQVR